MTVTDIRPVGADGASNEVASVVALLSEPPVDVPGVLERLRGLQTIAKMHPPRCDDDGLACFNYLYEQITAEVWDRLQSNKFGSAEFIARLDVEFAKRYFDAVLADASGSSVPQSWQVLLGRRADPDIERIQFAVAGVNAHVDYDLAFALLNTCRALNRPFGDEEQANYNAINQVFADHMRTLREHFESRWQRGLDRGLFAQVADGLGDHAVVVARDAAWNRAKHLATLDGRDFEKARAAIDWRAAMVGRALLDLPVL